MLNNVKTFINESKVREITRTTVTIATVALVVYINIKISEQRVDYIVDKIVKGIEAGKG